MQGFVYESGDSSVFEAGRAQGGHGMRSAAAVVFLFVIGGLLSAHTVTVDVLNVRSGPGTGYSIVGTLRKGAVVNVIGTSGAWSKINSPLTGWVYTAYLANTPHTTSGPDLVWPLSGRVTATWYYSSGGFHGAVDIAAPAWTKVGAARGGTVSIASWGYNGGYGNFIRLSHGNGYTTDYHHFIGFAVHAGQAVSRLQTIGYVGTTGMSTGYHCHFDLRRWGSKLYMPATRGQTVTKGTAVPKDFPGL